MSLGILMATDQAGTLETVVFSGLFRTTRRRASMIVLTRPWGI